MVEVEDGVVGMGKWTTEVFRSLIDKEVLKARTAKFGVTAREFDSMAVASVSGDGRLFLVTEDKCGSDTCYLDHRIVALADN